MCASVALYSRSDHECKRTTEVTDEVEDRRVGRSRVDLSLPPLFRVLVGFGPRRKGTIPWTRRTWDLALYPDRKVGDLRGVGLLGCDSLGIRILGRHGNDVPILEGAHTRGAGSLPCQRGHTRRDKGVEITCRTPVARESGTDDLTWCPFRQEGLKIFIRDIDRVQTVLFTVKLSRRLYKLH